MCTCIHKICCRKICVLYGERVIVRKECKVLKSWIINPLEYPWYVTFRHALWFALKVAKTGVPGWNQRPATISSHRVVLNTHRKEWEKKSQNLNKRYQRGNQKRTIQRNWQHRVHMTKKNKTKTQHNMCWIRYHYTKTNTNNVDKTWFDVYCYISKLHINKR